MATTHRSGALEQFIEFLRDAFDTDGIRRFFASFPPDDPIADHLTDRASLATLCSEAAEALRRCDAFGAALFERLRSEYAWRTVEIDRLERLLLGFRGDVSDRIASYRQRLAVTHRSLAVLDTDGPGEEPYVDLLAAFVPQRIEYGRPRTDQPDDERRNRDTEADQAQRPSTIDEILVAPQIPWVLLLGPQGAGKTTVTQWIMLRLCIDEHYPVTLPPDLVPVRVILRNFARRHLASAAQTYDFFDHLAAESREFSHALRRADFVRLADEGRLYWIFDGIDEILDEDEQSIVFEMIHGICMSGGRGLLTSRIAGCESIEARARRIGFRSVTLLPFDDRQVDLFLASWYGSAVPQSGVVSERRRELLGAAIRTNASLHDLSRNPFFLSLMAMHLGEPPYSLHGLLERATEQILVRWDQRRRIGGPLQFTHPMMRRYLEDLARHMMDAPGGVSNSILADDLRRWTREFCRQHIPGETNVADSLARELLDHLRERTCILGYTDTDSFGFLHRTFLSFLAASAVYHRLAPTDFNAVEGLFREHWHEGPWLQTLVLIYAFLRDEPDRVVRLVQAAANSAEPRFPFTALDSLAELCIVGLAEVDAVRPGVAHDLARRINAWLYYAPEWHGIQGRLGQLFAAVAGRWPGLVETMELPRASRRHSDFVLPFLCGLPDDEVLVRVERWIHERRITPFFVHRLEHAQRWRGGLTRILQDRAATSDERFTVLTYALALACEAFFPWSSELRSAVLRFVAPEDNPGWQDMMAAMDKQPAARAYIARLLRMELVLALGEEWPELVFSREFAEDLHIAGQFRPTGLEIVRRAFAAVAASPQPSAGLFHEIVRAQDMPFLGMLLEYCERHPSTMPGLHNALLYQPWEEGLARTSAWARDRPGSSEFVVELTALRAFLFPAMDPLFDRMERSLDVFARQEPPQIPTITWLSSVMTLIASAHSQDLRAPMRRLLEMGETRYTNRNLEYRLAVVALLGFGDNTALAPLIEQATIQRPLLAAHYRQYLHAPGSEAPIIDAATLIADVRNAEDERCLLDLARRERWNAFWQRRASPWRALYRHLAEHGSRAEIRLEAVLELAERDWVNRLRAEGFDVPELVDMTRYLDARDELLMIPMPTLRS